MQFNALAKVFLSLLFCKLRICLPCICQSMKCKPPHVCHIKQVKMDSNLLWDVWCSTSLSVCKWECGGLLCFGDSLNGQTLNSLCHRIDMTATDTSSACTILGLTSCFLWISWISWIRKTSNLGAKMHAKLKVQLVVCSTDSFGHQSQSMRPRVEQTFFLVSRRLVVNARCAVPLMPCNDGNAIVQESNACFKTTDSTSLTQDLRKKRLPVVLKNHSQNFLWMKQFHKHLAWHLVGEVINHSISSSRPNIHLQAPHQLQCHHDSDGAVSISCFQKANPKSWCLLCLKPPLSITTAWLGWMLWNQIDHTFLFLADRKCIQSFHPKRSCTVPWFGKWT